MANADLDVLFQRFVYSVVNERPNYGSISVGQRKLQVVDVEVLRVGDDTLVEHLHLEDGTELKGRELKLGGAERGGA